MTTSVIVWDVESGQQPSGTPPKGNRLARLRVAAQYSPSLVASWMDVPESTYLAWETGEQPIPDAERAFLADLYGVGVGYLMGDGEDGNGSDGEDNGAATEDAA